MGLSSIFKRKHDTGGEPAATAPDAVLNARTRARRRLIGATVLLGIGVIGFPLLFETQPRPIPVDIPIEIPRKDALPPLVIASAPQARPAPAAAPAAAVASAPSTPTMPAAPVTTARPEPAPASASRVITETAAEQGREVSVAAAPAASRPVVAASRPAAPPPARHAASATPRPTDDGQRAQALLEGKPAASRPVDPASAGRIVVQVGAYTDADKLREARQKVERLGLKTYTQVIEAEGGRRTRVRVGPFSSRDEADKVAARIKAAGLPVAILAL